ncbi:hypothetical protein HMPREF9406_1293 [Clostridium sp. HGF2]|nr:hypothetical protein HMPREF9406_1293 [Clostridium sp. HGF2]EQJ63455.1 hypothetical protein QSI_0283 [Clostridioides difficile P28]
MCSTRIAWGLARRIAQKDSDTREYKKIPSPQKETDASDSKQKAVVFSVQKNK